MERETKARRRCAAATGALLALAVGCSPDGAAALAALGADAGSRSDGFGGSPSGGGGQAQGAADAGASAPAQATAPSDAGLIHASEAGASPPLCQLDLQAAAEPPTVIVAADRSGSMFDPIDASSASAWSTLRTTLLAVLLELQGEVRFGFTAYSGDSEVCEELTSLPPALDNHGAIQALYGSLEASTRRDGGPFGALDDAASVLASAAGERYVWLVTDGVIDYCNDANPLCPIDSAVAQLQQLAAGDPPVRTTVFGLAPATSLLAASALQNFANAGEARPVALPSATPGVNDPNAIFDQCSSDARWAADLTASGKAIVRGQTVGNYAAEGGTATVYPPSAEPAALAGALRSQLAFRPCSFELEPAGPAGAGKTFDESASVELDGTLVPHDAVDGWHLVRPVTMRLEGASCAALRSATQVPTLTIRWECGT